MGILSYIFGSRRSLATTDEEKFVTLRDDGIRALRIGELPYAAKCLTAARALRPTDDRTTGLLAEALLSQGDDAGAAPLLAALVIRPDAMPALRQTYAATLGRLGRYADEAAAAESLPADGPLAPEGAYLRAEAAFGLGDTAGALAQLARSLDGTQGDPVRSAPALLLRARIHHTLGQPAAELADLDALVAAEPDNADYLRLRAHARINAAKGKDEGRTAEACTAAIADLRRVRSLNPFDRDAVQTLGSLLRQTGRTAEARALYDEALDEQPRFAEALEARADLRQALGDSAGAEADRIVAQQVRKAPAAPEAPYADGYTDLTNHLNERLRELNPYKF